MAKKTTKSATPSKKKTPAKKAAKKKTPAKSQEKQVEIELDPVEVEAFNLAHTSDKVCTDLEKAVTAAVSQAVRKVFKQHSVSLTAPQAEKVALLLFGD